jgi:hypothetical protein
MTEITTKIAIRLSVLTIASSIFAACFVGASNLAYAYLKILSPTKGQKIAAGSNLNLTGTSTPANATSQCLVSGIINGIHPYQKAIPAGNGSNNGTKDYRLWKFTDNPSYVTIKPGLNKITAKYSCFPMSDLSNKKQSMYKPEIMDASNINIIVVYSPKNVHE